MKHGVILGAAGAFCALAIGAAQAGAEAGPDELAAGKWRTSVQFSSISMPGMPPQVANMVKGRLMKPRSHDYCLKPEDIRRPGPGSFAGEGAKECKYEEWSYRGGKMRAVVVCKSGGGTMRMVMDGTGSPTAYRSSFNSTMTGSQMGAVRMAGTVTGERLGSC